MNKPGNQVAPSTALTMAEMQVRKLRLFRLFCCVVFLLVSGISFYSYSQKLPDDFYVSVRLAHSHLEKLRSDLADLKRLDRQGLTPGERHYITTEIQMGERLLKQSDKVLGSPLRELAKAILHAFWKPLLAIHLLCLVVLVACYSYLRKTIVDRMNG